MSLTEQISHEQTILTLKKLVKKIEDRQFTGVFFFASTDGKNVEIFDSLLDANFIQMMDSYHGIQSKMMRNILQATHLITSNRSDLDLGKEG